MLPSQPLGLERGLGWTDHVRLGSNLYTLSRSAVDEDVSAFEIGDHVAGVFARDYVSVPRRGLRGWQAGAIDIPFRKRRNGLLCGRTAGAQNQTHPNYKSHLKNTITDTSGHLCRPFL